MENKLNKIYDTKNHNGVKISYIFAGSVKKLINISSNIFPYPIKCKTALSG